MLRLVPLPLIIIFYPILTCNTPAYTFRFQQ